MTNWNRSLEPTETKSTACISSSSWNSSDGTSSMAPSLRLVGRWWPKRDRCRTSRSMISRACAISPSSVTIGSISFSSRPPAAFSSARTCVRSRPGRSSVRRIARQPSAGFSSCDRALEIGQHLVAADIDGAEGHRLAARRFEHVAIEPLLRLGAREGRGDHELQFGAEQADAGRARLGKLRQVDGQAGIHQQIDLRRRPWSPTASCAVRGRLPAGAPGSAPFPHRRASRSGCGRRCIVPSSPSTMMASPFSAMETAPFDLADDRNAHGARDDDHMAGRRRPLPAPAPRSLSRG